MFINPVFEQNQAERTDWAVVLLPPFPFQAKIWRDVASRLTLPYLTVDTPGFVAQSECESDVERAAANQGESAREDNLDVPADGVSLPADETNGSLADVLEAIADEQATSQDEAEPATPIELIEHHPHIAAYADAVAAAAQARGIKHLVVCGNSLGGYAAISLAGRHPSLVAGLVLAGTNADADNEEKRASRLKMASEEQAGNSQAAALAAGVGMLFSPESLQRYEKIALMATKWAWTESAPQGIIWAQRAMAARSKTLSVLKALNGLPARVLRGAEDSSSTAVQAQEMGEALGCKVIEIAQAGHLLPLEAPGHVAQAIQEVWDEAHSNAPAHV